MALLLFACAPSAENRIHDGLRQASQKGWHQTNIDTRDFKLSAFFPSDIPKTNTVYIYIEGDGVAWRNRNSPSDDPTPKKPLSMQLAMEHGSGAAYLARPCQYSGALDGACDDKKWWTSARFSPQVIESTGQAIDSIKTSYGASHVVLIGYSGGGAVAALVAARRTDVVKLITISGNLDTRAWTDLHNVSPLEGSLNPADEWAALQNIPQIHYVGSEDETVPPAIAIAYANRFPENKRPRIVTMNGYDHSCCWVENWAQLINTLEK